MIIREINQNGEWATKTYHFQTNHRGDVTSILDETGNEVGSYTYDSYGNVLSETGEITKENPIRYAGYYYDQETKHYNLKARYYNPDNGNFLALDPHPGDDEEPLSQNGYNYANNNPIYYLDPDGEIAGKEKIRLAIIAITATRLLIQYGQEKAKKYLKKKLKKAVKKITKEYDIK